MAQEGAEQNISTFPKMAPRQCLKRISYMFNSNLLLMLKKHHIKIGINRSTKVVTVTNLKTKLAYSFTFHKKGQACNIKNDKLFSLLILFVEHPEHRYQLDFLTKQLDLKNRHTVQSYISDVRNKLGVKGLLLCDDGKYYLTTGT
jgi:hypothetical protein